MHLTLHPTKWPSHRVSVTTIRISIVILTKKKNSKYNPSLNNESIFVKMPEKIPDNFTPEYFFSYFLGHNRYSLLHSLYSTMIHKLNEYTGKYICIHLFV